jgi:hypothetical protein
MTRSQSPFLTEMLLAVYERTHDRKWLADPVPAIEGYYRYWTSEPHLTRATGLSRYFDLGGGPSECRYRRKGNWRGPVPFYRRTKPAGGRQCASGFCSGGLNLQQALVDKQAGVTSNAFTYA